ncbi:RteC domain-containing protein [Labilibaculum sp.]|uniref:RteC domain-containing protein n=1 Tax=Labilibaculum sp. TaxID=2060723 RepID=UPI003564F700
MKKKKAFISESLYFASRGEKIRTSDPTPQELSRASFVLKKRGDDINLQCKTHTCVQEFKRHLTNLHIEFIAEVHDNLANLSTRQDFDFYLGMLLSAFELLKDLIGSYIEFEYMSANGKGESNEIAKSSCICFKQSDIVQKKQYHQYQKSIIERSIDLVSSFRQEAQLSLMGPDKITIMHEMAEFVSSLSQLRAELGRMSSDRKKIKFLITQRKKLAIEFVDKGIDLYNSSINIWFETRIEACKESIVNQQKKQKNKKPSLFWMGSKNDFLELMMSFDQTKIIGDSNGKAVSRKDLILKFSKFLGIQEIPDFESRITKLMSRNNPTAFLDRLRDKMKSLKNKKGF